MRPAATTIGAVIRPTESFDSIIRVLRFVSRCVGCDVLDAHYRVNMLTAVAAGAVLMYAAFTISTVAQVYRDDWKFLLEASCMSGSALQGANKLCVAVLTARQLYELSEQLRCIYAQYEQAGDDYCELLLRSCRKTKRALVLVAIGYVLGLAGMICTPLLANILSGKRHMIMHFHIPGVNVDTKLGFVLTQAAHITCLYAGGFGLYAGDICIILYLLQSFVYADILRLKVEALNKQCGKRQLQQEVKTTRMLIDIVQWHQIYQHFVSQCNKLFHVMVSVQIVSSAVCIVLTIFVLLTTDWLGAYPFLIILFPNMYIYCILGTLLETCNDNVNYEIYNVSFYKMSVGQQRIVLFMLAKSQQPDQMHVLGVMPLTVSTALQITKTIYSIAMMMVQFLMK